MTIEPPVLVSMSGGGEGADGDAPLGRGEVDLLLHWEAGQLGNAFDFADDSQPGESALGGAAMQPLADRILARPVVLGKRTADDDNQRSALRDRRW